MATRCPIFCWMVKIIIDIYIYLCVYVVEREIEGDKEWNPYINTLENMRNFFLLFFFKFLCVEFITQDMTMIITWRLFLKGNKVNRYIRLHPSNPRNQGQR